MAANKPTFKSVLTPQLLLRYSAAVQSIGDRIRCVLSARGSG